MIVIYNRNASVFKRPDWVVPSKAKDTKWTHLVSLFKTWLDRADGGAQNISRLKNSLLFKVSSGGFLCECLRTKLIKENRGGWHTF